MPLHHTYNVIEPYHQLGLVLGCCNKRIVGDVGVKEGRVGLACAIDSMILIVL